jgi:hypothetical protein
MRIGITLAIRAALLSGLVVFPTGSAFAQAGRADMSGIVLDQGNAVLPGATVTVRHEATGAERIVVTGADGRFIVPTLTPGVYTITAELSGFRSQSRSGLTLNVGQELRVDLVLSVAGVTEDVTVTAAAPVIEPTASRVGTQITNAEIDTLPSIGRNQLSLMQLVPGLTPSLEVGGFNGGEYNANGRDRGSNLFMLDGMSNQQGRQGGSLGGMTRMTLDTMAEFQVLTHQYGAEYGGASGVVVNAVSRSGTNMFSGRTFFYYQDDKLNAVEHFAKLAGQENPDSGSKIFGASFGGPIVQNRAFFFVNYERNIYDQAVSLAFPPEAAPLAMAYTDTAKSRTHNTFLRGDYNLSQSHSLSAKFVNEAGWEIGDGWQDDRSLRDNIQRERNGGDRVAHVSWMAVIGTRATNELKFGRISQDTKNGPEALFDENTNFIELAGRDEFDIPAMNEHPDYLAGSNPGRGAAEESNYSIDNVFTLVKSGWRGDHTIKVGAGFYRPGALPQITGGNSFGTFLFPTNLPFDPANSRTYPSLFSIRLGQVYFDITDKRTHGFVQDRWQLNNQLTLNLGFRYDYQTLTPGTKDAIAPRLGFAWDPGGDGRTVIRGGAGKFYEPLLLIIDTNLLQNAVIAPSFVYQTDEDESGLAGRIPANVCLQPAGVGGRAVIGPACRALLNDIRNQVAAGSFINTEPVVVGDRRMGYLWSFSLGVKRELIANMAASIDYVGNRGRDQTALIDINEPRLMPDGTRRRPGISVFDPTGELIPASARGAAFQRVRQFQTLDALNSDYNALELALEKRYSNRWSGRVSYTLAEANDVQAAALGGNNISTKRVADDLNPRSDYGRTAFDNRHAFASSVFVNPWRGLGVGAVFRAYWGVPINETVGSDVDGDRDNFDRPVRGVHDLTMPIRSEVDSTGRAIRNGIDGENLVLLDLRFQYMLQAGPRSIGLFWEMYNATNRVNYGNPTGNRRSSDFMVPTSAHNPRTMQLGVRYSF